MVAFFSNFWARTKFFSSKWPWEKSSLNSAIIWDTLETKKWKFNKKGCWWRPPSKMANFWARIKFYTSKWLWEKSSLVSAIILDTLVIKKRRFDKKGHNEGRPLKSSIFELELSYIAQNDQEKNCDYFCNNIRLFSNKEAKVWQFFFFFLVHS